MSEEQKQYKVPKQFTVLRSKWYRGKGDFYSRLLRKSDGKMCCVGFLARACGLQAKDIKDLAALDSIPNLPLELRQLRDQIAMSSIYGDNDNDVISPRQREDRLRKEFKRFGIRLIIKD